jgi:hypothetical protein
LAADEPLISRELATIVVTGFIQTPRAASLAVCRVNYQVAAIFGVAKRIA